MAAIARPARRAQRHFGQAAGSQPAQLDGGGDGHERLVGAHVRGGLLPADVLLPGAQGGDVGTPAFGVDGLPHQPSRQAPHVGPGAGEQPEVGPAEAKRHAQGLALPHHHVGAPVARRAQDAGADGVEGHDQQRAGAVAHGTRRGQVFEAAQDSWGRRPQPPPGCSASSVSPGPSRWGRPPAPRRRCRWPVPATNVPSTARHAGLSPADTHTRGPARGADRQVDGFHQRRRRRHRARRWPRPSPTAVPRGSGTRTPPAAPPGPPRAGTGCRR